MRYRSVAVIVGLAGLVSAGVGHAAGPAPLDPRAAVLEAEGRAALEHGTVADATDDFEAALAIDPGRDVLVLDLALAARRDGMPGKALRYYRTILARDPANLMALSGEGSALAEKGALDKARRDLARIQGLCGDTCDAARELAATLARVAQPPSAADTADPTDESSPKDESSAK